MIENTVKSCKNCTITEVWVQIIGTPKNKFDPTDPYPLFKNLKDSLEEKESRQLNCTVSYPVRHTPTQSQNAPILNSIPAWNGEIKWKEDNIVKVLRLGDHFLGLHSIFKESHYSNYEQSFENSFKRIMGHIEEKNTFEVIQIIFRYINTIDLAKEQNGDFHIGKYLKATVGFNLEQPLLSSVFNYEFMSSSKENRIIGLNTRFSVAPKDENKIATSIRTTGIQSLEQKIKLNNDQIFSEVKGIKDELKTVFFDVMTDYTKNDIMEVQYA